jgi:hypothetical protein
MEALRHQARQRRLTDTRRPPQNHRMRLFGFKRNPQRFARAEQMLLADNLIKCAGAQPFG